MNLILQFETRILSSGLKIWGNRSILKIVFDKLSKFDVTVKEGKNKQNVKNMVRWTNHDFDHDTPNNHYWKNNLQ